MDAEPFSEEQLSVNTGVDPVGRIHRAGAKHSGVLAACELQGAGLGHHSFLSFLLDSGRAGGNEAQIFGTVPKLLVPFLNGRFSSCPAVTTPQESEPVPGV